jgi:hypothetical protein
MEPAIRVGEGLVERVDTAFIAQIFQVIQFALFSHWCLLLSLLFLANTNAIIDVEYIPTGSIQLPGIVLWVGTRRLNCPREAVLASWHGQQGHENGNRDQTWTVEEQLVAAQMASDPAYGRGHRIALHPAVAKHLHKLQRRYRRELTCCASSFPKFFLSASMDRSQDVFMFVPEKMTSFNLVAIS